MCYGSRNSSWKVRLERVQVGAGMNSSCLLGGQMDSLRDVRHPSDNAPNGTCSPVQMRCQGAARVLPHSGLSGAADCQTPSPPPVDPGNSTFYSRPSSTNLNLDPSNPPTTQPGAPPRTTAAETIPKIRNRHCVSGISSLAIQARPLPLFIPGSRSIERRQIGRVDGGHWPRILSTDQTTPASNAKMPKCSARRELAGVGG